MILVFFFVTLQIHLFACKIPMFVTAVENCRIVRRGDIVTAAFDVFFAFSSIYGMVQHQFYPSPTWQRSLFGQILRYFHARKDEFFACPITVVCE